MEEQQRIALGEYLPDVPPLSNPGLVSMTNAVPIAGGYNGVNGLSQVSGFTALAERPRGSLASIDSSGNPFNFVGTETKIYRLKETAAGTEDVTRSSGAYNCSGDLTWDATIFRDTVIFVNPGDETQYFDIGTSTAFAKLGNATTTAPRAKTVSLMGQGQFVMCGNTFDLTNGLDETAVQWSALNDPFNWPFGTEAALAVSAGRQPLAGDGGAVQKIVGGLEVGAIFQERNIFRCDFIGGNEAFAFTPVEIGRGLLVPAFAIPFGRNIFYLSEDGFYVFDYTTSQPVGRERVDRTFLADIDMSNAHRCSAAADPDNQRIWMLYPGSGNSGGTPNRCLVYDWSLNQFARVDLTAEWLTRSVGAGRSLDSPGIVGDPDTTADDPAYPLGGVDGAGLESFDARIADPGALSLGAYNESFELSDFTGTALAATFETGRRELAPGFRSLANRARVLVDSKNATIRAAGLPRTNATTTFGPKQEIDEDGDAPLRVDGRYHAFKLECPSGFSNALGMDVYFQRSGKR